MYIEYTIDNAFDTVEFRKYNYFLKFNSIFISISYNYKYYLFEIEINIYGWRSSGMKSLIESEVLLTVSSSLYVL